MSQPALLPALDAIEVIAPNFKCRHSGVTSTVIRLVPVQAQSIAIVASGPDLPPEVPNLPPSRLPWLTARPSNAPRVWHARRNVEMVGGLALKYLARKKLKLVFTSAAQRHHTGFTRWLIRQMDAVIATSTKSAGFLEREATVINHGIDCDRFTPVEDRAAMRRSLDLPAEGPLVGCFGRIRHQKGNDLFVECMLRVFAQTPQGTALVLGRATREHKAYLKDLKDKVAAHDMSDRILFRDEVPFEQLTDHFQALDLYVAPHRREGFGLTPLEAMACGVPVVATRAGAFEDLVLSGKTGYLIDIEDIEAMTRRTLELVIDAKKRADFAKNSRARALKHFTIERESASIIEIYRCLLSDA